MARPVAGRWAMGDGHGARAVPHPFLLTWAYARHARLRRDRARWNCGGTHRNWRAVRGRRPVTGDHQTLALLLFTIGLVAVTLRPYDLGEWATARFGGGSTPAGGCSRPWRMVCHRGRLHVGSSTRDRRTNIAPYCRYATGRCTAWDSSSRGWSCCLLFLVAEPGAQLRALHSGRRGGRADGQAAGAGSPWGVLGHPCPFCIWWRRWSARAAWVGAAAGADERCGAGWDGRRCEGAHGGLRVVGRDAARPPPGSRS